MARKEQKTKKLKNEYLVASNCPKFYVPTLNKEIIKNKNIHHYYKSNDNRSFPSERSIKGSGCSGNIANLCLEADNKDEVINSKYVVVQVIDPLTLLGKMNHQITFERNERLRNALPEDYKTICEQDHSESKELLGMIWVTM